MKRLLMLACVALWASTAVAADQKAKEYSADMTFTGGPGGEGPGKLYNGKDGVRMEMSKGGQHMAVIHNRAKNETRMLMLDRKVAMNLNGEGRPGAPNPSDLFSHFGTSGDPCAAKFEDGSACKRLGKEKLGGKELDKFELSKVVKGEPELMTVWTDPAIGSVVKMNNEKRHAGFELSNIKLGAQPAELFTVPADFTMMGAMGGPPGMGPPGMKGRPPGASPK